MRIDDIKPQLIIVMGGAGSGKNYFIDKNYPEYKLIDVDTVKQNLPLSAAISAIKPMLVDAFTNKENVAHPTTGTNLAAQQRKIKLAKSYGYTVTLVLIDTDPATAIAQVRNRVRQGGHDVELEQIVAGNKKARVNYEILKALADQAKVVS